MARNVTLNLDLPESHYAVVREHATKHQIHEGAVLKALCAKALENQESLPVVASPKQTPRISRSNRQQN